MPASEGGRADVELLERWTIHKIVSLGTSDFTAQAKGFIFCSGGNFDQYIGQHVNSEKDAAWKPTKKLLVNHVVKIPTTTRNQSLSLTLAISLRSLCCQVQVCSHCA